MTRSIREFRNRHAGEDVYVIAAGGTLNYLDPKFFANKTTIAVNLVAIHWAIDPTYIVTKYHEHGEENAARFPDVPVIIPRFQWGNLNEPETTLDLYVFDHIMNQGEHFDATRHWPSRPDDLVVSWSTITTAMHFAAYIGAATVVMVAHDCGQLGDQLYVKGYAVGLDPQSFEAQSIAVKKQLIERYGVRVYSLSPFINYNLEGVPYIGTNLINLKEPEPSAAATIPNH